MQYKPWAYQERATQFVEEHTACGLFLEMGLGKTVATLTAINDLMYDQFSISRVLVIAPLRVAYDTWARECQKWDHLRHLTISKVLGSQAERIAALESEADLYVINRENVAWLVEHLQEGKRPWPFDMIVIDELSSFKSPRSQRFKALRKVRPMAQRIVGLTGTPAPNGLIDLWSQLYLLDGGQRLEKTLGQYRERYFSPGRRTQNVVYDWTLREGSEAAIRGKISDICISMSAADWLCLPPRIDVERRIQIPCMEKYRQLEREKVLELASGDIVAPNAAALANKLLQLANGAAYDQDHFEAWLHDEKLFALEDIVEEAQGQPVLCFYSYRHDLKRIRNYMGGQELKDEADIAAWNRGEIPLLLCHPASAGHGLNLQDGGHIVVWFGLPWSLELYQQANARLHRQGQTQPVRIYHIIAEGTMDENVMQVLAGKAARQDDLLAALKARIEKVKGALKP